MRHVVSWCVALLISAVLAQSAFAVDWDAKRVEKVLADLKAGKPVAESGTLTKADTQMVTVVVNENLTYVIDYRAKICFASQGGAQALVFVPCTALKRGYPVLSPILAWDEPMQRRQMPPAMMRRENAPGGIPRAGGAPPRQQQ